MNALKKYGVWLAVLLIITWVSLGTITQPQELPNQYIKVLGIAQDGGYPHIGCQKVCCQLYYQGKETKKYVTSLGVVDQLAKKRYLIEASPDITDQLRLLNQELQFSNQVDGVFLTHAHIGHYSGLMYLGREAQGAQKVPVYAMPRMSKYLTLNGPWSQLVSLKNIQLMPINNHRSVVLDNSLKFTPFLVPHRDEFSETVGFTIEGNTKKALFIPDIDKWHLWEKDIIAEVKKVDYAFLDATFYSDGEIPRPMNEVPHPFIEETMKLFQNESKATRSKIIFIHLNHSNPAILEGHPKKKQLESQGYQVARQGAIYKL